MPRPYSEIFIRELARADQKNLGIRLANVCVKAQLPALYVSNALNVSRRTMHLWFRGNEVSSLNQAKVEDFIKEVEADLEEGLLPAKGLKAAKEYLQSISEPQV
jgi:hypothetical protein